MPQIITPPPNPVSVTPPAFVRETGLTEVAQGTTLSGAVAAGVGDTLLAFLDTTTTAAAATPAQVGAEWGAAQPGTLQVPTPLAAHTVTAGNDVIVSVVMAATQGGASSLTPYVQFSSGTALLNGLGSGPSTVLPRLAMQKILNGTALVAVFRATVTGSGTVVLFVSNNGNYQTALAVSAIEVSSLDPTSSVDVVGINHSTNGTVAASVSAITTTGNEFLLAVLGSGMAAPAGAGNGQTFNPSTAPTVGASWATNNTAGAGVDNAVLQTAWEVSAAASGAAQTFTANLDASHPWAALLVAFKAAPAVGGARTISTLTDTGGNAWTRVAQQVTNGAASNQATELWSCVAAASPGTLTATATGTCTMVGTVVEFSSMGGIQGYLTAAGNSTALATSTGANANPSDIVLAFLSQAAAAVLTGPTSGYTVLTQRSSSGGGFPVTVQAAYLLPNAVANEAYRVTSDTVAPWTGFLVIWSGSSTATAGVSSVAGRTGAVTLAEADIGNLVGDLTAKAPLASPAFTGTPTFPAKAISPLAGAQPWLPTGAIAESFSRKAAALTSTAALTSGLVTLVGIYLPTGTVITSITAYSSTTAAVTPAHQIFGLYDNALTLLRQTVDDLATAWAANAAKTLALTSTYTTTREGIFYVALMVAAATVPTLYVSVIGASSAPALVVPVIAAQDTAHAGLTTALPAAATASTGTSQPWVYVA